MEHDVNNIIYNLIQFICKQSQEFVLLLFISYSGPEAPLCLFRCGAVSLGQSAPLFTQMRSCFGGTKRPLIHSDAESLFTCATVMVDGCETTHKLQQAAIVENCLFQCIRTKMHMIIAAKSISFIRPSISLSLSFDHDSIRFTAIEAFQCRNDET